MANASHELRTPLAAERTLVQVALADPEATAETLRSTCQLVLVLGDQHERLIEALLTLASSERGVERWEPFDLANLPGGWVGISTMMTADQATIRVSNTGPVITSDELERLFQPFQRLGGVRTPNGDGYGLGLSIVRAIASAHGATLTSRAQPEGGLDIEVSFPRAQPRGAPDPPA